MLAPAPYQQVAEWLDAHVAALPGEEVPSSDALGRVLGEAVAAPGDVPSTPAAALDGFALSAAATVGASDYNPLPFRVVEAGDPGSGGARPVVSGESLPDDADTVISLAETELRSNRLEIYAPLASGENVIPAAREARSGDRLLEAGRVLRASDIALLGECGIANVAARRRPRVSVVLVRESGGDTSGPMITSLIRQDGGLAEITGTGEALADTLAARPGDLMIVIGGSGLGPNDHAAAALEQAGELAFRGVAINPGETAGLGRVGDTPVVMLPGPPLAALFAYDCLAGRAVRRLAGRTPGPPYGTKKASLERKIASGLGRLECCRVRVRGENAEPLAVADNRTLSTVARSDGFVMVPEHSEGFAADAEVEVFLYDQRY